MLQQHVGCSARTGGILLFSDCHDDNTSRNEIKPVYNLSTYSERISNPKQPGKRERRDVEPLDVACPQRSQQWLQGSTRQGNKRCAARSELLPGSCGQVSVSVSWLTAVPSVMNEVLWVIHESRIQGGADGVASAANPAFHHMSPSHLGLPKGNSPHPCFRKPSEASPCVEWQNAASLPRLWALSKTLFVFSSVSKVLCVFLAQLISCNTQLLQFISAA